MNNQIIEARKYEDCDSFAEMMGSLSVRTHRRILPDVIESSAHRKMVLAWHSGDKTKWLISEWKAARDEYAALQRIYAPRYEIPFNCCEGILRNLEQAELAENFVK